jgi:hypothetical protein
MRAMVVAVSPMVVAVSLVPVWLKESAALEAPSVRALPEVPAA